MTTQNGATAAVLLILEPGTSTEALLMPSAAGDGISSPIPEDPDCAAAVSANVIAVKAECS